MGHAMAGGCGYAGTLHKTKMERKTAAKFNQLSVALRPCATACATEALPHPMLQPGALETSPAYPCYPAVRIMYLAQASHRMMKTVKTV